MKLLNRSIASLGILLVVAPLSTYAQMGADAANKDQAIQQGMEKAADGKPAAPATTAPKPDAAKPPADVKPKWNGSVTGGVQFSRGQTNADGLSVMGSADYVGPERGYRIEGIDMFARVHVPVGKGVEQTFVAQDRRSIFFTFFQQIKGRTFVVSRVSAEHDIARDVKYRVMNLTGIGYRLAEGKRLQALVVPGVGFSRENKPGIRDGAVFTPGIYQGASYKLGKYWSLEQWAQYRGNSHNSHDYSLDANAALVGMITARLGFQFTYIYSYEGLVGQYGGNTVAGIPYRSLSQTTIGLRFRL